MRVPQQLQVAYSLSNSMYILRLRNLLIYAAATESSTTIINTLFIHLEWLLVLVVVPQLHTHND